MMLTVRIQEDVSVAAAFNSGVEVLDLSGATAVPLPTGGLSRPITGVLLG